LPSCSLAPGRCNSCPFVHARTHTGRLATFICTLRVPAANDTKLSMARHKVATDRCTSSGPKLGLVYYTIDSIANRPATGDPSSSADVAQPINWYVASAGASTACANAGETAVVYVDAHTPSTTTSPWIVCGLYRPLDQTVDTCVMTSSPPRPSATVSPTTMLPAAARSPLTYRKWPEVTRNTAPVAVWI
jgi:hypothetical protein